MRTELPPEGYLEGVRELASRHEVVLIFDEVSSGFRIALGGVQEFAGVTPDLSVFAKAISNGYPMAAVVGKREFMEPSSRMFISSAYWDDNVGIVAALTTLKELQRRDAVSHFERLGAEFKERINKVARDVGVRAECVGIAAHPGIRFEVDDPADAGKVATLFVQENARRGLILSTGFFFNCSHDEAALAKTEEVVAESFAVVAEGLQQGRLDDLLECDIQEDLFRRLVR
jgi:glutamate-1-semialdehyde aminotransferase